MLPRVGGASRKEEKVEQTIRWVPVPVPEGMVPEVMESVLARAREMAAAGREERSAGPEGATPDGPDAYHNGWAEDELRDVLENPTRAMGIVLRHLATHPDEKVDGYTLAEEVYGEGANANQLGGALGSFTRRVRRDHGKEKWPFDAFRNGEKRLWEYSMDARTAEAIRRILGI